METKPAWNYIALSDYAAPSAPLAEAAHNRLKRFWRLLRPGRLATPDPSRETTQQSSLTFFGELFASPDWDSSSFHLAEAVDAGLANGRAAQVFVGGPHRCTPDMLRHLARKKNWPVLEAPTPQEILERRFDRASLGDRAVIVIPQLAHWFLRHDDGLDVVRRLIDWLGASRQAMVLGCHSWAWSYLDKAIQISAALPEPRVLAPLDAEALRNWIQQLGRGCSTPRTVFREASSGKIVVEVNDSSPESKTAETNGDASNLLTHIAARGRGIPEITWSLWRESILRFDQKMLTEAALKTVEDREERTIWVPAWAQLNLPELPGNPGHLLLFLLHTLLLHAGPPAEILPALLPFTRVEIQRGLRDLQGRGLAALDDGRWRVTEAGYPFVRGLLHNEGCLLDNL